MRIVLDTNVFISGLLLPQSIPGRIVQAWRQAQYTLVVSNFMLVEIERVLNYPKIRRRLNWSNEKVEGYISMLRFYTDVISVSEVMPSLPQDLIRDSNDLPILATFIAGSADWLVTGDEDLHAVREQYPICSPADFLAMLGPQSN